MWLRGDLPCQTLYTAKRKKCTGPGPVMCVLLQRHPIGGSTCGWTEVNFCLPSDAGTSCGCPTLLSTRTMPVPVNKERLRPQSLSPARSSERIGDIGRMVHSTTSTDSPVFLHLCRDIFLKNLIRFPHWEVGKYDMVELKFVLD